MANELTFGGSLQINTFQELKSIAEILIQSGMFPETRSVSQAAVKILAGRELGFQPFAAMTGIHIIQGKPVIGAILLAALIKRSKLYDYKVVTLNPQQCVLEFLQNGTAFGRASMTLEEAKLSGIAITKDGKSLKDNWARSPANMLFARCISNGQKWYCPDLLLGVAVYTEDEITTENEDILGPREFIPHDPPQEQFGATTRDLDAELVTDPNAQSPAETTPQANSIELLSKKQLVEILMEAQPHAESNKLSPTQIQTLRELYQQQQCSPQRMQRILATIQVKATDLIPQTQFEWVCRMVTAGQISMEQSDRISQLVEQLNLPWEKVAQRLLEKFGEPTLVRLTMAQGEEIETSLKQVAKKQTSPPTPMPPPNPNSLLGAAKQALAS